MMKLVSSIDTVRGFLTLCYSVEAEPEQVAYELTFMVHGNKQELIKEVFKAMPSTYTASNYCAGKIFFLDGVIDSIRKM